jgi:hypothetical protein
VSDFVDKLAQRRPSVGGKAQARRDQLLARWGSRQVDAGTIEIDSMGGREVWRRLNGDLFEQEVRS